MKGKILVVDDDANILDALKFMLEDAGYKVETVGKNGGVINKEIRDDRPDLILLDVLLSGHDGRDICKNLKGQKATKNIPVIMISAHPDAEKTSLQAGANFFLPKPFEVDMLLAKIEKYIPVR